MSKKHLGIIGAMGSALIFGFTPILGRLTYDGGSNAIMLVFLRNLLALPVLFVLLRAKGISLRLSRTELWDVLWVGGLGGASTALLLYGSYEYIPVGVATTLHFLYPAVVTLAGMLLFKEKANPLKLLALGLGLAGILLFLEGGGDVGAVGLLMAVASSVTYTIYMLGVERTSLAKMHYFKLTFYICAVAALVAGVFGLLAGKLTLALTPTAWLYSFLVSMLVSVGAITLFQLSITLISASTTAILSTLEPITSVVLGILVLGESLSLRKVLGCGFILACVVIATLQQMRQEADTAVATAPADADAAQPPPAGG